MNLEEIIERLSKHGRAATYAAVADHLSRPRQSLMDGRNHCHRDSWIVSAKTHKPTGYAPSLIDPRLSASVQQFGVISSRQSLAEWLAINP